MFRRPASTALRGLLRDGDGASEAETGWRHSRGIDLDDVSIKKSDLVPTFCSAAATGAKKAGASS